MSAGVGSRSRQRRRTRFQARARTSRARSESPRISQVLKRPVGVFSPGDSSSTGVMVMVGPFVPAGKHLLQPNENFRSYTLRLGHVSAGAGQNTSACLGLYARRAMRTVAHVPDRG